VIRMLSEAAMAMQGVLTGDDRAFSGISTDTRTLREGQLFFALQGPNFDGRDYVAAAREKGAAGAVVPASVDDEISQVFVDDTRLALGRFGAAWRDRQEATVVAVTGSNGKTTLKELIAACLGAHSATIATQGNLNNDIGVPLMLSRIEPQHRFAVLEMGANHAGEIAYLTSLVRPDVVAITNAGPAHLEGFGSIEGVAHAKGEILQGRHRPRCAVLNADDRYFDLWRSMAADVRILAFGFDAKADVRATDIRASSDHSDFLLHIGDASARISLPLPGVHNVRNACAAAAVAHALGLSIDTIAKAIANVRPVSGRLQPVAGVHGATLFDDSYNANPLSVIAATEFLATLPGESWLVLGDMKELGEDAEELHREVGEAARANGVSRLFALGDLAREAVEGFGDHARWYASIDTLVDEVSGMLKPGVNVLVKGSRSMRMERVVDALRDPGPARKEA